MDCGLCIYYWTGSQYVIWRSFCDEGCFCDGPPGQPPLVQDSTSFVYVDCLPPELTTTPAPTTTGTPTTTTTGEPTTTTTEGPTTTTTEGPSTSTTTTTTTSDPFCFGRSCVYAWNQDQADWVLVEDNCMDPCVCLPQGQIFQHYGHNFSDPNERLVLPCIQKPRNYREVTPPFRGCLYGIIHKPIGPLELPTTPPYTGYYCDYGDPVRRTEFARFFELLFDACDGNCPTTSIQITFNTTQQREAIRQQILAFLRANFTDSDVFDIGTLDYLSSAYVNHIPVSYWEELYYSERAVWFRCPSRMFCEEDTYLPYVPGTIIPSVTVAPSQCCCPGLGEPPTTGDLRYYPMDPAQLRLLLANFTPSRFPRGWVVYGDHYLDDAGLHCTDPAGCFVYPCIFKEENLKNMN